MLRLAKWSNLKLRTKGLIVVAFPAAATVIIACAAYVLGGLAESAGVRATHSREVCEELERMKVRETRTTALARAYFITRDDTYAEGARKNIAKVDSSWQKLAGLTRDNSRQSRRLSEISEIERLRVERIVVDFTRARSGALSAQELAQSVYAAEGERLKMEKLIASMSGEEKQLLATHAAQAQSLHTWMRAAIGVFAALGVLGGLAMSLLFASGITSRIRELQENVAKLAAGGRLNPGPGGRDEIGLLSASVADAAEILRQKTAALEQALHGIAQVDASGRFLSINRVCRELLERSGLHDPADIVSSVHPDDRDAVQQAVARMRLEDRGEVEARIPHADGTTVDVAMAFLPVTADSNGGYYIFLRDISLQKKTEAELIRAKDAAVTSSQAKTDFLAKVSHNIRTPLNAILGSADLLSRTQLDPDQHEYVSMFQRNCRQLVALINDFLDFARIEAGVVGVQRLAFRPRQAVEDVAATFREAAYHKRVALRVEITPDVPDWLMGDPSRIQQILANLLSNALKFIRQGEVVVRLTATGQPSRGVRFEVIDTGPGIAAADREKIFTPFTQLPDQSATSVRGSGLGLTICRDLVQLMDGDIGLQSEEGVGSTFHFTVPLECPQPGQLMPDASQTQYPFRELRAGIPVRILIAEDTEDNRILMRLYLRDQPVVLEFAENGQEAIEAVRRPGDFDLILMDIDMPVLEGRAATRRIHEWEEATGRPPTPVVALSGHAILEECRLCFKAGCVAHVAKPVDQATLIETIERYARAPQTTSRVRAAEISKPMEISEELAALVPKYLASKPGEIEEALVHLGAGNFDPIRRFGHNLKGTGRGYGFPEIEELGRALEQSADKVDNAEIAGQLLALHRLVTEATAALALGS